jgi:hypothetical protein
MRGPSEAAAESCIPIRNRSDRISRLSTIPPRAKVRVEIRYFEESGGNRSRRKTRIGELGPRPRASTESTACPKADQLRRIFRPPAPGPRCKPAPSARSTSEDDGSASRAPRSTCPTRSKRGTRRARRALAQAKTRRAVARAKAVARMKTVARAKTVRPGSRPPDCPANLRYCCSTDRICCRRS